MSSWSKQTEHLGQYIRVNRTDIEWVRYELPSTSYSGGGSQTYRHDEFYANSSLYKTVVVEFGQIAADQILKCIQDLIR